MKALSVIACAALTAAGGICSADVDLVRDGKACSVIVVKKDAPAPLRFGAAELSRFLGKIAGGTPPAVAERAVPGRNAVFIGTTADAGLVKESGIASGDLKEEGFAIAAGGNRVYVIGRDPRGALYGCYEILKRHGGVRFLVPGDDGTYFTKKGTVSVPDGKQVSNPYLRVRSNVATDVETYKWMVRNNMQPSAGSASFYNPRTGKRTANADLYESLTVEGVATYGNSHILSNLLGGWDGRTIRKNMEKLYAEHPEYFPLIGGKRVMILSAESPNPCISNPALLDHMADNLYRRINVKHGTDTYVTIGNNDTPIWCECAKCNALDDPAMAGTKGAASNRYWYMVNEIARRIWAKNPKIKLGGWAYQNFWYPPTKVKIDPRLRVIISFNNQCWRHAITDQSCSVNAELRKIMAMWAKTGLPLIVNRDEISADGALASEYLPAEKVLYRNFLDYPSLGFSGSYFCVTGPFPPVLKWAKNRPPYFSRNLKWYAMWQTCYLSAVFMWDASRNYDALYEEANALYYGKAWEGGFREFRKLQQKAFYETPGCIGWGQGAPLGRCLDQPGMEQKLLALLDQAVKVAKTDPDPRVLAHVLRDRELFSIRWLAERKNYLKNFKELNVYRRTAPIRIDGVIEEADWKNADVVSNFKAGGMTPAGTKVQQSFVRVTYDQDNLYIAVEMMEPNPGAMAAGTKVARNDSGWSALGNHVELFYNYPDMAGKYYHLAINHHGQIIDALQLAPSSRDSKFKTGAEYAVRVFKDRWTLEIRIPCSEIGMKCFDGATWKLNVARSRKIAESGGKYRVESSSACNGLHHAVDSFINIKFVPARASGISQNRQVSSWANANFDDGVENGKINRHYRWRKWKFRDEKQLVPKGWNGNTAVGEYLLHDGSGSNRYVRLEGGYIGQYFVSDAPGKLKVSFRARGKGSLVLWSSPYVSHADKKMRGYKMLKEYSSSHAFRLSPEWKTFTCEVKKAGRPTERVMVRFMVSGKDGNYADLDDCYVTPLPE